LCQEEAVMIAMWLPPACGRDVRVTGDGRLKAGLRARGTARGACLLLYVGHALVVEVDVVVFIGAGRGRPWRRGGVG